MQNEDYQCCNQENSIVNKWLFSENIEYLQEILDSGFDINMTDQKGNTAIFDAGVEKSLFLIKKVINLTVKNQNLDNALSYSYWKKDIEKIRLISDYIEESDLTFNINLEKHIAASSKNKAMLWFFFLRTLPPIFKIREKSLKHHLKNI